MPNPKLITIGKLKLAYKLSQIDVDGLYKELLPDNVYPLVLWETAYNEHWLWSLKSNAQCYGTDIPKFPDTPPLPEKYFTYSIHSHSINEFFDELRIKTKIDALERGVDFIIECTYGNDCFPFEEEKKVLFASLHEEERLIQNWQRTSGPLHIHFMNSTNYEFISKLLFDSVAVDKIAAIHYFSVIRNYPFIHEVKGITQSLVDSVVRTAKQDTLPILEGDTAQEETNLKAQPHQDYKNTVLIPRALWEKKLPQQVCDDMRVAGYDDDAPIAHALYYWVGIKNFTEIGTVLRGDDIGHSARQKHARKKLKEAEGRFRTE